MSVIKINDAIVMVTNAIRKYKIKIATLQWEQINNLLNVQYMVPKRNVKTDDLLPSSVQWPKQITEKSTLV